MKLKNLKNLDESTRTMKQGYRGKKVVAVLPAYNEEKRIGEVIGKLKSYVDEIVVSDDGSRDRSVEVARRAGAKVVSAPINKGAGHATRIGCEYAIEKVGADVVVLIDADGQHPPEKIPELLKEIEKGYEFVFTNRLADSRGMPFVKKIGNLWLSFVTNLLAGTSISDTQSGFRAFTASAYKKMGMKTDGYEICSEFVLKVGRRKIRYCQIPISSEYDEWTKRKGTSIKTGVVVFFRLIRIALFS
jgi:glycosyltransferase involved in cell wall biosynthesis